MSQEIEIEYKNLLTKDEFNSLLSNLSFPRKGQVQINYYFETADLALRNKLSALKIKKKIIKFLKKLLLRHFWVLLGEIPDFNAAFIYVPY